MKKNTKTMANQKPKKTVRFILYPTKSVRNMNDLRWFVTGVGIKEPIPVAPIDLARFLVEVLKEAKHNGTI